MGERDGRHRRRDRLRDHDGSRPHSADRRRKTAAARFAWRCGAAKSRDCSGRWRTSPSTSAWSRIRSPSTRSSTRTGTSTPARAAFAAHRFLGRRRPASILAQFLKPFEEWGVYGASTTNEPRDRRHRQHVIQSGRAAGDRREPGLDRIQQHDASHEPRHLRTHRAGRRDEGLGDHGVGRAITSPIATR